MSEPAPIFRLVSPSWRSSATRAPLDAKPNARFEAASRRSSEGRSPAPAMIAGLGTRDPMPGPPRKIACEEERTAHRPHADAGCRGRSLWTTMDGDVGCRAQPTVKALDSMTNTEEPWRCT